MAAATAQWRVRSEDGVGEGQPVEWPRLRQAVADGGWSEAAQVRGPQDDRWIPIGDHPQLVEFLPRQPLLRPRPGEEAEMDMTPMIDVTFQLIIFFMITATFVVQKTLPTPEADPDRQRPMTLRQLQQGNIIVRITADATVTVDGRPTTVDALPEALIEAAKDRDNVEMVMDIADEVDYQLVVQAIDAAAGAQIEKVHLARRVRLDSQPQRP